MSASLSKLLTDPNLLLALVVLFGGGISASMLAFLLANVYFLPGPPSPWSLRVGVGTALLGAALTGIGITLAVLGHLRWGSLRVPVGVMAAGAVVYLAGLSWLEISSRPDAEW